MFIPYWAPLLVCITVASLSPFSTLRLSVIPAAVLRLTRLLSETRFSLRTLLIVTTLVADRAGSDCLRDATLTSAAMKFRKLRIVWSVGLGLG